MTQTKFEEVKTNPRYAGSTLVSRTGWWLNNYAISCRRYVTVLCRNLFEIVCGSFLCIDQTARDSVYNGNK